jgi:hypothetical protein
MRTDFPKVVRPDPDPFLYVSYGGEKHCIAVWDERDFIDRT